MPNVAMAIDFSKWKAEPSGIHSHTEHGNEESLKRNLKLEIGN